MPSCIKYATFKIVRNVQKSKWWQEKMVTHPREGHQNHLILATSYFLRKSNVQNVVLSDPLQFLLLIIKDI